MALPPVNLERDATILGDLQNFAVLREMQNPSTDAVRLHAAAVRRLLLEGVLPAACGNRGLKLAFTAPDANPLQRAARNRYVSLYVVGGAEVFGATLRNLSVVLRPFQQEPGREVELKLDSFLKQSVAFCAGELLTRHDVVLYVANKAGGVHWDQKASGALSTAKMRALGLLRRSLNLRVEDGKPVVSADLNPNEEQSETFRYEPAAIDAVYLEFLATIQWIQDSPQVKALRAAIEADLK
jgi:hypothetical protein